MIFVPIIYGAVLGGLLFAFVYTASKRSGRIYLAPLVTFGVAVVLFLYGLLVVRGFGGMGYGILGFGFLLADILATLLLPLIVKKHPGKEQDFSRADIWKLFLLPLAGLVIIFTVNTMDEPYWIIDKGQELPGESESHYQISTISEGSKQISVHLGKKYIGKLIHIKKVKQLGRTEITLKVEDKGEPGKTPYIKMGIDEIHDPLTIQTDDGQKIEPL